jgi:hypothetical protein
MGRTPLRKRTKQWITKRIVSAAAELTKAWGYHPTTMGASLKKRKPARGTLLNYFLSKEAKLLPWGLEILEQQVRPWLRTYLSTQPASWPVFQFPFAKIGDDLRGNTGISIRRSYEKRRALAFSPTGWGRYGFSTDSYPGTPLSAGVRRDPNRSSQENIASYASTLQVSLFMRALEPTLAEYPSPEIDRLPAPWRGG